MSQLENYELLERCGAGAYGEVFRAKDCTGREVALKRIAKKGRKEEHWQLEYKSLSRYAKAEIRDNGLVPVYHVWMDNDYLYYTMPLADNRATDGTYRADTLAARLELTKLSPAETSQITRVIFDALIVLHSAGFIHHDVKPENIVFIKGLPCLVDIGICSALSPESSLKGTPGYIPPQFLAPNGIDENFASKPGIDFYALGKVTYAMFTGNSVDKFPSIDAQLLNTPPRRQS